MIGKLCKYHFICFLITIFILEVTIFNYQHWCSLNYNTVEAVDYLSEFGSGLVEEDGKYRVVNTQEAYIKFKSMDFKINNVYIDAINTNNKGININLFATDEAHSKAIFCGDTIIVDQVEKTKYLNMHLAGKSDTFEIYFTNHGALIDIGFIAFNSRIPFSISFYRIAFELFLGIFFIVFNSKSQIYKIGLFSKNRFVYFSIFICAVVTMIIYGFIGNIINPDYEIAIVTQESWPANEQYVELANALIDGKVVLDREPNEQLKNLDNPYDPTQRETLQLLEGEKIDIDYAYYNGKYYSYFGVVPALLFYVPYKLLTGENLKTWDLVTVCGMLFCIAVFGFLYELCRKYFSKVSLGLYLLSSIFLIFSSSVIYLIYAGIVYSVPIITALFFGMAGLWLWLSSSQNGKIIKWRLGLGSCFIALILGCRPHLILIFILAIPIFWKETIYQRKFFSKRGFINTVVVMTPFILVGIGIMYYNKIRFSSVFDFGATYNITSNDMNHRGWILERLPLGYFIYIFQPLCVTAKFPFLQLCSYSNDYLGYSTYEPIFGGILSYNLLMYANFLFFKIRKYLKEKGVFLLAVFLSSLGILIITLDTQLSGLVQRYISDFSWLFGITSIIVIMEYEEKVQFLDIKIERIFRTVVGIAVLSCVILNCWNILIDGRYYELKYCNPKLYYSIKYMMPFI